MAEVRPFQWFEATSVEEAVTALDKFHQAGTPARLMAGGTDLIGGMKDNLQDHRFEVLVHINNIPELKFVQEGDEGLTIGALASITDLEFNPLVREQYPALYMSAYQVASPQIRNVGTLGGNINQRPRCWYYRHQAYNCYKKGGDFCFAVTGDNQYHAIIGGELCYIVHPADTPPALIALDAQAKIVGPEGERVVPLEEYFVGPRVDVLRETMLGPSDILTEIQIPRPQPNTNGAYLKVNERGVWDFATVAAATTLAFEGDVVADARIVLGGVAPTPLRVPEAEQMLIGQKLTEDLARSAAEKAVLHRSTRPLSLNAYKVDITKVIVRRALLASAA